MAAEVTGTFIKNSTKARGLPNPFASLGAKIAVISVFGSKLKIYHPGDYNHLQGLNRLAGGGAAALFKMGLGSPHGRT